MTGSANAARTASGLRATTRALSDVEAKGLDLLAFAGDDGLLFVREGVGLAARGEAMRITLPRGTSDVRGVAAALRSIETDDALHRAGSGPIAIGALAFTPSDTGSLVVPEVVVAKSGDGTAWCTQIRPLDGPAWIDPVLVATRTHRWSPHGFDLHSVVSHETWCDIISTAVARIHEGGLDKVVLARAVDVVATSELVIGDILGRLQALFPSCMVFSVEGFVGASPSCSSPAKARRSGPIRSPARSPEAAIPTPTPRSPPDCWRPPRTAGSIRW